MASSWGIIKTGMRCQGRRQSDKVLLHGDGALVAEQCNQSAANLAGLIQPFETSEALRPHPHDLPGVGKRLLEGVQKCQSLDTFPLIVQVRRGT